MSYTLSQDYLPESGRLTFMGKASDLLSRVMMRFSTRGVSLLLVMQALLISGCMKLGPDYQIPEATVEADWLVSEDPPLTSKPLTDPKWWKTAFQDDDLNRLVETAFKQNLTLRSAGLRVL